MATNRPQTFHNYDTFTQGAQDTSWQVTSVQQQSPFGNFTMDGAAPDPYETHNIKGKLIKVEYSVDNFTMESSADPKIFEEKIKLELCHKIAEKLYQDNMVQWMKQSENYGQTTQYRAYVYVTSSDDVQVIRKVLK